MFVINNVELEVCKCFKVRLNGGILEFKISVVGKFSKLLPILYLVFDLKF
jgi:hypothetical protein